MEMEIKINTSNKEVRLNLKARKNVYIILIGNDFMIESLAKLVNTM